MQSPLPIIVGGGGAKRTPALAARFATEFNLPFVPFDEIGGKFAGVHAACEAIGRNPDELVYSAAFVAAAGANEAEYVRRSSAIGRQPDELRQNGLAGTASEIVDRLGSLQDDGVECAYLQILDLGDLDHLEFVAAEVVPHFS